MSQHLREDKMRLGSKCLPSTGPPHLEWGAGGSVALVPSHGSPPPVLWQCGI